MNSSPQDKYLRVMQTIRERFDLINQIKTSEGNQFFIAETCAFHCRKIIEGIAFACLIAVENGITYLPRDAKGQWNAAKIISALEKKDLGTAFPSPSIIRKATLEEIRNHSTPITIEGQTNKRINSDELKSIYTGIHTWNHELNPYTNDGQLSFLKKNENNLWLSLDKIWNLIEKHAISIQGKMFFCVLKDDIDGQVKVVSGVNFKN